MVDQPLCQRDTGVECCSLLLINFLRYIFLRWLLIFTARNQTFTCCLSLTTPVIGKTGTGRNKSAHDNVFLQTAQLVSLAHDRSLGKYASCLFERSSINKGIRRQRSLRNPAQHMLESRRKLTLRINTIIFSQQLGTLNLFGLDELAITRFDDRDATQHLTNDHLNVFIVNLNALETVDVLYFIGDIARQRLHALQAKNIVRIRLPFNDFFTLVNDLAIMHKNVFVFWNKVFMGVSIQIGDDQ